MDRHTPFLVMIRTVQRILPTPPAPRLRLAGSIHFSLGHAATLPETSARSTVDFSHEEAYKDTAMKPFTTVAVVVFTLVAVVHLLRILLGWEVTIQGAVVPMWVSYLGLIIAGGLAFLLWRESR